jgi:hypothetical protein
MTRVGRVASDSDQIKWRIEIHGLHALIEQRHLVVPGYEAGEVRHGQLGKVVELPPPESADEWVLRGDE